MSAMGRKRPCVQVRKPMVTCHRLVVGLIFLALSCSAAAKPGAIPNSGVISRIEAGLALHRHFEEVGVWGTTARGLNRAARRKVRHVSCKPADRGAAICTYLIEGDGWRTNRFERSELQMPAAPAYGGWELVSP
jgi:hypothetical protein